MREEDCLVKFGLELGRITEGQCTIGLLGLHILVPVAGSAFPLAFRIPVQGLRACLGASSLL